jgi:hypothetical protein
VSIETTGRVLGVLVRSTSVGIGRGQETAVDVAMLPVVSVTTVRDTIRRENFKMSNHAGQQLPGRDGGGRV